ncbi:MAG: DUF1016 N-terminal domain-containing protein [Nanoarchaeota archaeon]
MKKQIIPTKQDYNKILGSIITHIEQSKLRAFAEVNKALLQAYWSIGKELSKNAGYGESIVEQLSKDLRLKYPDVKGYSARNLWNMKRFYETYQKLQPVVAELLFKVSWTNHILILDKTSSDEEKQFYLKICIKERWSKNLIGNFSLFAVLVSVIAIALSLNVNAKAYAIQNQSVNQFVVNGSPGNIILNPNFGIAKVMLL